MKRSEIIESMSFFYDQCTDPLAVKTTKQRMSDLLTFLESQGMIPPEAADFNIGNNWEPEESRVEELNKIGKRISNQINAEVQKSMGGLVEQCYDILKEYEEPYGKSVVEQVNAEIKELNKIVDILKENDVI